MRGTVLFTVRIVCLSGEEVVNMVRQHGTTANQHSATEQVQCALEMTRKLVSKRNLRQGSSVTDFHIEVLVVEVLETARRDVLKVTRVSNRHSSVSYRHTRYVKAKERRA